MKVNELRLTNFVFPITRNAGVYLPQNKPVKILSIGFFDCEVLPINENPAQTEFRYKYDNSDLSPIPLKEEWFVKLGFELETLNGHKFYSKGRLQYCSECDLWWILGVKIDGYKDVRLPKYVHELQNLYFAITGKELTCT